MSTYTGGPLQGSSYPNQRPKGVLLVNKDAGEVIIYDVTPIETATPTLAPREEILPLQRTGEKNITRAADEHKYDVLTYDQSRMGPWLL